MIRGASAFLLLVLTACATPAPAGPAPAPMPDRPRNVTVKNESHREIRIDFDQRNRTADVRLAEGVRPGTEVTVAAAPGDYRILVGGQPTNESIHVPDGRAVRMVIKGSRTQYLEVVTAVVEDGRPLRTVIVLSQGVR